MKNSKGPIIILELTTLPSIPTGKNKAWANIIRNKKFKKTLRSLNEIRIGGKIFWVARFDGHSNNTKIIFNKDLSEYSEEFSSEVEVFAVISEKSIRAIEFKDSDGMTIWKI